MSEGDPMEIVFTQPPCGSLAKFTLEGATDITPCSILRGPRFSVTLLCTRNSGHEGAHQAAAGTVALGWLP